MESHPEGGDRAAGSDDNTAHENGDQLTKTTLAVLNNFTSNYVRQHGGDTSVLPGVEESTDPDIKKVVEHLQKIGDKLDQDVDFQRLMLSCLPMTPENFMKVAKEFFSDNKYNWGRVVTLLCFSCQLIMNAIADKAKQIMAWTLEFIDEYVLNWIKRQGGWVRGLLSVSGTG